MELGITTPALLFPAISLLLLAYTNRFLALATLVRQLKAQYQPGGDGGVNLNLRSQIVNLRNRIRVIQRMQEAGSVSFFLCTLCMFAIYAELVMLGQLLFGASILLLAISLAFSVYEIHISVKALDLHLSDLEDRCD